MDVVEVAIDVRGRGRGVYAMASRTIVIDDCVDPVAYNCIIENVRKTLEAMENVKLYNVYDIYYLRNGTVEASIHFDSCKIKGRVCIEKAVVNVMVDTSVENAKQRAEEEAEELARIVNNSIRGCMRS